MHKYYPPEHWKAEFHCIHCDVFATQRWSHFFCGDGGDDGCNYERHQTLQYCVCGHCRKESIWYEGRMLVPSAVPVPPPHSEMPEECIAEYEEAKNIVTLSPRAASALVRLALQKLMVVLGEKGKNINDDIGKLVKNGLPIQVQQALDFCRVVGNNAVHPGKIEINDTPEIAHNLFAMMNFIIEDRIARPKQIRALYLQLPEEARMAIEERDRE